MRKLDDEELGVLITRETLSMMFDKTISFENRARLFCAVVGDLKITDNKMMASFAASLKTGHNRINEHRKAAIYSRRERQKEYQRNLRQSKNANGDIQTSTEIAEDERTSVGNAKHCKISISPYKPPKGGKRKVPKALSPEDIVSQPVEGSGEADGVRNATLDELAAMLASDIEKTDAFAHMRVNRRNLMRHLIPLVKKNCAAEGGGEGGTSDEERKAFSKMRQLLLAGLAAWTEKWASDGWQYAPGKITKWLADEKWLEAPRKKAAAAEGSGCGDCGAEIA